MSFSVRKLLCTVAVARSLAFSSQLAEQPSFSLDPKALLATTQDDQAKSDYDVVVLLDEDHLSFTADGQIHHTTRLVFKVLTTQGVEDWSSIEWRWEPWREKRPVIRARVITPDGVAHQLDPKTIVDAAPPSEDSNTYSDVRTVRCPLPAVAAGAIVEEEIVESSTALLTGEVTRFVFGRNVPVRESRLLLDYPDSLPVRYTAFLLPALKTTKTADAGVTHLLLANDALAAQDETEPMLPPDVPRAPQIIVSSAASWQSLAAAYHRIVEEQLAAAPVAEIVSRAAESQTQERSLLISRLLRQLHKEIRYTGVEFGDAAIVPAKPADTLKRKYGDCKDKSALLVAMLRQVNIPAYLALLNSGPGQDIDPGYPGFGLFDHAIVFVPGSPDMWIDATAEFSQLGVLPAADQGRLALIVRPETTTLAAIPESPSSADQQIQTREFFLPDYGKARVVETSEGIGNGDAAFRSDYGSADTDDRRKQLSKYMRDEYISDAAVKINHPKADDFSTPFQLRLEIDNAARGSVTQLDGAVGVPLSGLFEDMPQYFRTPEKKATADDAAKPRKPRTSDFVMQRAFIAEWRYRIHLPPGFHAVKLPNPQSKQFGPAMFTSQFSGDNDVILADFKFDSVRRRYTAEEGKQLKKELSAFLDQPGPVIRFEPIGQTYLAAGQIREAIDQFNSMAQKFPTKPVYRVQLSSALLGAGCGRKAREEARRAVDMDPKSPLVYQNLGFTLLHDLIGRPLAKGFDPVGAEAAFRKAIELDPKEPLYRRNLAVILEHNENGERYESPERLNDAIKVYREMGEDLAPNGLTNNLLFDLAYTRRFQELKTEAEKLPQSAQNLAFKIVAATELENSSAAIKLVESETSDQPTRSAALVAAAAMFLRLREYPAAAEMFAAGAKDAQNSAQVVRTANTVRMVRRFDDLPSRADSPENLMKLNLLAAFSSKADASSLKKIYSKEAAEGLKDADWLDRYSKMHSVRTSIRKLLAVSDQGALDFMLSIVQMKTEPNGDDGNRVLLTLPGSAAQSIFVVREGTEFRFLGDNSEAEGVARRVLQDVKQGNLEAARHWLDWLRDEIKIGGGDDPFSAPLFPRIWVKGSQADEATIRFAAASLLISSKTAKDVVPLLRQARESAKDDQAKTLAGVAFVSACLQSAQYDAALPVAQDLAQAHPESSLAVQLLYRTYRRLRRWSDLERLASERLKRDPDDTEAKRFLVWSKVDQSQFVEAETLSRQLAESPKGTPDDWNQFGWLSVFAGDVTPEKIDLTQRAAGTNSPAIVHTVATMYADLGKNTEARETVLAAMQNWGLDEPNGAVWLVFGRLADRLGIRDEALADYAKSEPAEIESNESNYSLAQRWQALLKKQ